MFVLVLVVVLGCFGKVQAGYEDEYDDEDEDDFRRRFLIAQQKGRQFYVWFILQDRG